MTSSAEVLKALRELADVKQLERSELNDLLRDGIQAALVKRYGPNVRSESVRQLTPCPFLRER